VLTVRCGREPSRPHPDRDQGPHLHAPSYGLRVGALVNNLRAVASGNMMIVLNLGLGMNLRLWWVSWGRSRA